MKDGRLISRLLTKNLQNPRIAAAAHYYKQSRPHHLYGRHRASASQRGIAEIVRRAIMARFSPAALQVRIRRALLTLTA